MTSLGEPLDNYNYLSWDEGVTPVQDFAPEQFEQFIEVGAVFGGGLWSGTLVHLSFVRARKPPLAAVGLFTTMTVTHSLKPMAQVLLRNS